MRTLQARTRLSPADLDTIRQLAGECNQFEELTMKLNWPSLQSRAGQVTDDFMMIEDRRLVGYLALYAFNQQEAEISAMTHPACRRQGIFKQLLAAARSTLAERRIPDLLFICEQKSTSARSCMTAIGSRYEFSEYKMTLAEVPPLEPIHGLRLRLAQADDLAQLVQLDHLCFNVEPEISQAYLTNEKRSRNRRMFIAMVDDLIVGKIQVTLGADEIYLSGFCLWPDYRRQGYGRSILTQIVNQLNRERRQPIALEVACANRQALNLYQSCGFQEVTAYDYYRQPV